MTGTTGGFNSTFSRTRFHDAGNHILRRRTGHSTLRAHFTGTLGSNGLSRLHRVVVSRRVIYPVSNAGG